MPFTIETLMTFEGQGQGWSEAFWWQQDTNNLLTAQATVTPILQARAKLLASTYVLTVARNSVVRDAANAKVLRVTDLMEPRYPGVPQWDPSTPNLALMAYWQNPTNTASKKVYMRGIPDGVAGNGKQPFMGFAPGGGAPTFQTAWNNFTSKMLNLPAGWLVTTPTTSLVITGYTVDPDTAQVYFTLSVPMGFAWPVPNGVQMAVYVKIPGKSPLDGRLVIVPQTPTTCYTAGSHPTAPLPTGQLGTMQIRTPSFTPVSTTGQAGVLGQIDPQRIVTHKTGRPIYASRGRAPKKVVW